MAYDLLDFITGTAFNVNKQLNIMIILPNNSTGGGGTAGNPDPVLITAKTLAPTMTNTPEALLPEEGVVFRTLFLAFIDEENTGTVLVGFDDGSTFIPQVMLPRGSTGRIDAPVGQVYNLNEVYFQFTDGNDTLNVAYS